MPQDTSASDDDLDFLDDLLETSSKSNEAEEDDIALPDFDYIEGKTEVSSSPKGEMDEGYVEDSDDIAMPDFDYIEGKTEVSSSPKGEMDEGYVEDSDDIAMPDFDYIEGKTEVSSSPKGEMDEQLSEEVVSQGDKVLSEDEKNSMLADMDSILTETDEKPSKEIESVETETIKPEISAETEIIEPTEVAGWTSLGFLKLSKTLVSQHLYLSIVYTILVFTTFEVVNPNTLIGLRNKLHFDTLPVLVVDCTMFKGFYRKMCIQLTVEHIKHVEIECSSNTFAIVIGCLEYIDILNPIGP